MSFAPSIGASAARSGLVAIGAVLLAALLVRRESGRWHTPSLLWALAFVPLLPVLYVYGQRCFPPKSSWSAEAWSIGLQITKFAPWAALLGSTVPPAPLDASARYLMRLGPANSRWWGAFARLRFGDGRRSLLLGCFVFALAVQEFECASLLGRPAWTVWLFDAQAGGLPLATTLRLALPIGLFTAAILAAVLAFLAHDVPRRDRSVVRSPRWTAHTLRVGATIACFAGLVVFPAVVLARSRGGGGITVWSSFTDQWFASAAFAGTAAWCASALARGLAHRPVWLLALLVVPGATGGLAVSLTVQSLFLQTPLRGLYDTPIPLLLAMTLWLLPFAAVLERAARQRSESPATHSAALLALGDAQQRRSARWLREWLERRVHWTALLLLFSIAAFEVQASAILAPTRFTPAAVRLYNLMHYGHSETLSWLLGATVCVLLSIATGATLLRWAIIRYGRGLAR